MYLGALLQAGRGSESAQDAKPSPDLPDPGLYLCVDGGGTAVKVVVMNQHGEVGRAVGPPCNVKSAGGPQNALSTILQTTWRALQDLPGSLLFPVDRVTPEPIHLHLFQRVWLGLAGALHQADIDAVREVASRAFGFAEDDARLRITNDGHLLAAPSVLLPCIESTIVLVAGTGSVGLAFRKRGQGLDVGLDLVGVSGGWGYLLGDEGSAYCVGRLAIRRLMTAADARLSFSLANPSSKPAPLLPLFSALLIHLRASDPAHLIDKAYTHHSDPASSTFAERETERKLWIAEGARLVFSYAFEDSDADDESRAMARSILEEALGPLVETTLTLIGDRSVVDPSKGALFLGGGLWNSEGYLRMLTTSLAAKQVAFAKVGIVKSAAEEGARALVALDKDT
ncbi:hypothetical protein JCM21900_005443 [Sporobolomyces salmonicolor]